MPTSFESVDAGNQWSVYCRIRNEFVSFHFQVFMFEWTVLLLCLMRKGRSSSEQAKKRKQKIAKGKKKKAKRKSRKKHFFPGKLKHVITYLMYKIGLVMSSRFLYEAILPE